MKFKKGDTVIVTIGKDKGKKGKIEKVFPKEHAVLVTGVNLYKRHLKKRDERQPHGIVELSRPLMLAKVALVCPACGKPTRAGFLLTRAEKVRTCRKCQQKI
ncbi:MAG: 50S ribosomal protein L24 [Patescibacteria group bacterium]